MKNANVRALTFGAALGTLYGIFIRLAFRGNDKLNDTFVVMSIAFLFVMPLVSGFLSVYFAEIRQKQSIHVWILVPWLTILGGSVAMIAFAIEGWICIIMYFPVGLACSSIGGVVGGLIARSKRLKRVGNITTACILFLPFVFSPMESPLFRRREIRFVENVIEVQASPAAVWDQIKTVPAIRKDELQPSWSHRIGFPDPIAATLSYEGVGGVRRASFDGGVLFIETVDSWEPQHRLSFSIHPETAQIPNKTLDEHVTVGGPYFDVLRGEYRIESLPNGKVRLHLTSWQRVSTDFNWYAHLWTDAVMSDLQKRILYVVQQRAEAEQKLENSAGN
ncbi:MAG TPA: hypothetical protein VLK33_04285 [Terriglobales bacterium]|nr:hypothetical protein [Terriglobales bacterium]